MTINLEQLVEILPELTQLVLPGYIFIECFLFFSTGKRGDTSLISINTLLTSQLLTVFYYFVQNKLGYEKNNIDLVIISIFSALFGVVGGYILGTQQIKEFTENYFHVSLSSNPWITLPNRRKGIYVDVHLKEESLCYRGAFLRFFEHNNETWLVIANHYLIDPTTKSRVLPEDTNKITGQLDSPPQIIVNIKDVNRVEFAAVPADISAIEQ